MKSLLAYGYAFLVSSVIHLVAVWAGETILQTGGGNSPSETPAAATCIRLDLILAGDTRPALETKASSVEKIDSGVYPDREEPEATSAEEVIFSGWEAGKAENFSEWEAGCAADRNRYLKPRPVQEIKSIYPLEARMRGEEGAVDIKVSVNAFGGIEKINLVRASGFNTLDQAALEAVENSQFKPAFFEGKPVSGQVLIRIYFRLNDNN